MNMKKLNKKGFTLVELIIVIAIIAILAVSAWLMLVKWIGKSKDASVLAALNTIDKALQVTYADKMSYPTPGSYTTVNISGVSQSFKEGYLDDSTVGSMNNTLDRTPKNLSGSAYYYSLSDNNKYQIAWQKEDGTWVTRWSYGYVAIANWTQTSAYVAELPSLFLVNSDWTLTGGTLTSGSNYKFIVDIVGIKDVSGYYYTGGVNLTNSTVINNIYTNLVYNGSIGTGALKAQLLSQVWQ